MNFNVWQASVVQCAACAEKRQHTAEEWKNHPLAGHGYTPESGSTVAGVWTHIGISRDSNGDVVSLQIDSAGK